MAKHKTHYEDCDVLVVGGGMAGTGATFEARHWGRDMTVSYTHLTLPTTLQV